MHKLGSRDDISESEQEQSHVNGKQTAQQLQQQQQQQEQLILANIS